MTDDIVARLRESDGGYFVRKMFTEAADELYLHALIEIGLVLFVITLIVNGLSRLLIWSMARSGQSRKPARPAEASA